jgi:hypothetical protein
LVAPSDAVSFSSGTVIAGILAPIVPRAGCGRVKFLDHDEADNGRSQAQHRAAGLRRSSSMRQDRDYAFGKISGSDDLTASCEAAVVCPVALRAASHCRRRASAIS